LLVVTQVVQISRWRLDLIFSQSEEGFSKSGYGKEKSKKGSSIKFSEGVKENYYSLSFNDSLAITEMTVILQHKKMKNIAIKDHVGRFEIASPNC